jgi:RHS repeat-associated protein
LGLDFDIDFLTIDQPMPPDLMEDPISVKTGEYMLFAKDMPIRGTSIDVRRTYRSYPVDGSSGTGECNGTGQFALDDEWWIRDVNYIYTWIFPPEAYDIGQFPCMPGFGMDYLWCKHHPRYYCKFIPGGPYEICVTLTVTGEWYKRTHCACSYEGCECFYQWTPFSISVGVCKSTDGTVRKWSGTGQDHGFFPIVRPSEDPNKIFIDDGGNWRLPYIRTPGSEPNQYISPPGRYKWLRENTSGDYKYTIFDKHGQEQHFDSDGKLRKIEDRKGGATDFTYTDSKLTTITDDRGQEINLYYTTTDGLLSDINDAAGRNVHYTYDDGKNLVGVRDANGLTTSYTYDQNHRLTTIEDGAGRTWLRNYYDSDGRVEKQTYGDANSTLKYEPDSNRTTITSQRDVNTLYNYNDDGKITAETTYTYNTKLRPTDPDYYLTRHEYDANMNVTRKILPAGNCIRKTYDVNGNMLSMAIDPNYGSDPCITARFEYQERFNLLKKITDPRGNITDLDYNPNNPNLGKITFPEVNILDVNGSVMVKRPQMNFTYYNDTNQVETVTSPDGIILKYEYGDDPENDANNYKRIVKVIVDANEADPCALKITTTYKYDAAGNVVEVNDPNGNVTKLAYNALDKLTKITDPCNYSTSMFYNNAKMLSRIERKRNTEPNQIIDLEYNILDKVEKITDPLGNITRLGYDAGGNLGDINDAEQNKTQYQYDERNLLWRVTAADGNKTEYSYTLNGKLSQIKDANGSTTGFDYDRYDRLTKITYPDSNYEQFGYDASSNVISYKNRNGQTIQYKYDALNRLIDKKRPNEPNIIFRYDIAGRVVDVNDGRTTAEGGGITKYKYDRIGRVSEVNDIYSKVVKYEYDKRGLRTMAVYPGDYNIVYEYDALARLKKIRRKLTGTLLITQATYSYDELSRRTQLLRYMGAKTTYEYDIANRLTRLTNDFNEPGGTATTYDYNNYDKVGNRLKCKINDANAKTYTYDDLYQLIYVDYNDGNTTNYYYDALGNRTQVTNGVQTSYESNKLNQYSKVNAVNYQYDNNGNLTYDGIYTYIYDCENRLSEVKQGQTTIATYAYDFAGRRIRKTAGSTTTRYCYDGDQIIADYNDSGVLQRRYVYGRGIDEPLYMTAGLYTYYYFFDGLGSVVALARGDQPAEETYSYDVFGKPTIRNAQGGILTTSAFGNTRMFTGREYEAETGLYYYRARYYHPTIGRFLQTDPIRYRTGLNMYSYCGNNPIMWIDPWGLCRKELDALENELAELIDNYLKQMSRFYDGIYHDCDEYQKQTLKMNLDTEHFCIDQVYGNKTGWGWGPPRLGRIGYQTGECFIIVCDAYGNIVLMLDPWTPGPTPFFNRHWGSAPWIWGPDGTPLGP